MPWQGLGLIVFIDANAAPPNEIERKNIAVAYGKLARIVRGAVQVVEGHGFIAAAMRGALASLLGPAMDSRIDAAALTRAASMLRNLQSDRVSNG